VASLGPRARSIASVTLRGSQFALRTSHKVQYMRRLLMNRLVSHERMQGRITLPPSPEQRRLHQKGTQMLRRKRGLWPMTAMGHKLIAGS
jgi:hypothetical protein